MSESPLSKIPCNNKELLEIWFRRSRESQFAHYEAAKYLSRRNYFLGIPVIVLTTIVGTSIFASFQEQNMIWLRIILGLVSVAAAVLSALQTFLRFQERAEKHRSAGASFGSIRREIEQLFIDIENAKVMTQSLDAIRKRFDSLSKEAPEIPNSIWKKAESKSGDRD